MKIVKWIDYWLIKHKDYLERKFNFRELVLGKCWGYFDIKRKYLPGHLAHRLGFVESIVYPDKYAIELFRSARKHIYNLLYKRV